jgi:DNA-binding winged helix-turn-helix (wHTH) protein
MLRQPRVIARVAVSVITAAILAASAALGPGPAAAATGDTQLRQALLTASQAASVTGYTSRLTVKKTTCQTEDRVRSCINELATSGNSSDDTVGPWIVGVGRASNLSVANALLNEAAADLEGGYVLVERTPTKVVIVTTSDRELQARVEALGRRLVPQQAAAAPDQEPLVFDGLVIDLAGRRVVVAEEEVELTQREFDLLALLAQRAGRVVTRLDILDHVWDGETDLRSNAIDVHVAKLRAKVDRPFGRESIETVRGVGFRLAEPQSV